jgi:hypothetical protein
MRWLSLFLACQHLNWGGNLCECEDQSSSNAQAGPVFPFGLCTSKMLSLTFLRCLHASLWVRVPQVEDHWPVAYKILPCSCTSIVRDLWADIRVWRLRNTNQGADNYIAMFDKWSSTAECFKTSFTTLKAYKMYSENMYSVLKCHNVTRHAEF